MSDLTHQPDETDRVGFLLHDASRLLRKRFETRASCYGLSAAQWRLLVRVFKEEGIAQARLAELLEIEPISVSRLIDRMEEGGWIERRNDMSDRRVRTIYLTEKSRAIFNQMRGMAAQVFDYALNGLSADERRTTISALKTIISNLSDDDRMAAALKDTEKAA
ncbi:MULTISPECIES: MarR family winged helix-turn-helix transcriptional regulator [Mesorhizobium]|uniref:MarR family transcriptional regulator n=1 Tax=Mesorhizobium denitrificans TaxID=2294114 RepID=A0A371XHM2_9HYPH|nr:MULTISPECIES: MarR family transcriptional regulator [Mesorhizobium]RFC68706.1 MarR family transcriptional regulator [Mesorhizobium denitrificans]